MVDIQHNTPAVPLAPVTPVNPAGPAEERACQL